MKKQLIRIEGNDATVLSISLNDVLASIESLSNYHWSILFFEGIGNIEGTSIIDFEEKINNSKYGYRISANELTSIANTIDQLIWITLIGDANIKNLKKYETDEEMYNQCQICIELIDSSYWEVCAEVQEIAKISQHIVGSTYLLREFEKI